MKYRIFVAVLLLAVLAAVAIATQDQPSSVAAPTSTSADDNSMKTLKIE